MSKEVAIRECVTLEELEECVQLQRDVFSLPEIELSPVRHLVVTKNAGGFTLGAYSGDELVGFVLSVPAFYRGERAIYSHMTAVREDFQSAGVGGALKWAQRDRSLADGIKVIRWTFEPWKARNAYFNLEKLGAVMDRFERDFYGVDRTTGPNAGHAIELSSDRLFAEWHLESEKVVKLAAGEKFEEAGEVVGAVEVPNDWFALVADDPQKAIAVQKQIRRDFEAAFADGLLARGFHRDERHPKYLLFRS